MPGKLRVHELAKKLGITSKELLTTLTSPMGMRQAIILREILDRPIDRW